MSQTKQTNCFYCNEEQLSRSVVGLNKKLVHRQTTKIMCLSCLATYCETTEDELRDLVDEFKRQGCALF